MTNLISAGTLERRYTQARELAQALLARSPKLQSARMSIAWTYLAEGHPESALPEYARISPTGPIGKMMAAQALARRRPSGGSAQSHQSHFSLLYIKVERSFDRLRNSPRSQALLK